MIENIENNKLQKEDHEVDGVKKLSFRMDSKNTISRKDFIKLGGVALTSIFLPSHLPGENEPLERFLIPDKIHNTDVYGLEEKITSEIQIERLYKHLDNIFVSKDHLKITYKKNQRKELFNPNKRYLEVVVRQSAYDSFINRQKETHADFVEWIEMHTDAMNRCFEEAKPSTNGKSVLRRIIVISDDMPKNFWCESDYRKGNGCALDAAWELRFYNNFPIDTDESWAIADDYRVNTLKENMQSFFWSFYHSEAKTIFGYPPGADENNYFKEYRFPEKNDSLRSKNGVWLDFGLIHEWSHYLWNLPDEYVQDVHCENQRFQHFLFSTGSFHEPYFSAYLSYLTQKNIELNKRGPLSYNDIVYTINHPLQTNIGVVGKNSEVESLEIRGVKLNIMNDFYSGRSISDCPDQVVTDNIINFNNNLFEGNTNCWQIHCNLKNGYSKEIYLPGAAFEMSKIASVNNAYYCIYLSEFDNPDKKTQIVELVDQSDIDRFLQDKEDKGDNPYAKMKVDGTDTWFVWSLRD